jgi:hypothetical protein
MKAEEIGGGGMGRGARVWRDSLTFLQMKCGSVFRMSEGTLAFTLHNSKNDWRGKDIA